MKRALALFWSLCFLSGCAGGRGTAVNTSELLSRPFSSRISLEWCAEQYEGSFSRDAQGGLLLTLTGEELTVPVSFTCAQGSCEIAQGELLLTLDETSLPSTSLPSALQNGFVMLQSAAAQQEKGELLLEAGTVKLFCRGEDLTYSRLQLDRGSIDFTEFTFSGN